MSDFKDYEEFAAPLVLRINGTEYEIPPVTAKDGIEYQTVYGDDPKAVVQYADLFRIFLGSAYTQMLDDGVSLVALKQAAKTAWADFLCGRDVAKSVWENVGTDPKVTTPEKTPKASKGSHNTGAANTTNSRASTNTTKTSRKS